MKPFIITILFIFSLFFNTIAQCVTNPTASISYISTSGSNCTYSVNLSLTSNQNSIKWMYFVIAGTQVCFRSNGTNFVVDNTCGSGTSGSNIGNTATTVNLTGYQFTIPCSQSPVVSWAGSISAPLSNNCAEGTYTLVYPFKVKLRDFKLTNRMTDVKLDWETYSEENFEHFVIQKSFDSKTFEDIGVIEPNDSKIYHYVDSSPKDGISYFRLKMIDIDGSFEFSKILSSVFSKEKVTNVYPNPSIDNQIVIHEEANNIILNDIKGSSLAFKAIKLNGQTIVSPIQNLSNTEVILSYTTSLEISKTIKVIFR